METSPDHCTQSSGQQSRINASILLMYGISMGCKQPAPEFAVTPVRTRLFCAPFMNTRLFALYNYPINYINSRFLRLPPGAHSLQLPSPKSRHSAVFHQCRGAGTLPATACSSAEASRTPHNTSTCCRTAFKYRVLLADQGSAEAQHAGRLPPLRTALR